MKRSKKHRDVLLQRLKNPDYAVKYLNEILEDEDPLLLLSALKDVAEAMGGLSKLADKTNLDRANLYKILSSEGNPEFHTLLAILNALGLRFAMQEKESVSRV